MIARLTSKKKWKFEKIATLNGNIGWRRQNNKRKYKKSETVKEWCMLSVEVESLQLELDRKKFK